MYEALCQTLNIKQHPRQSSQYLRTQENNITVLASFQVYDYWFYQSEKEESENE